MSADQLLLLVVGSAIVGLLYVVWKIVWILKQPAGNEKMQRIASYIARGARAFLRAEYSVLSVFVLIVAIILALTVGKQSSPLIALSFVVGAFVSGLAGYVGMTVTTKANVRTAEAARHSLNRALKVAFSGGSVMGMGVVSLGLLALGILLLIYMQVFDRNMPEYWSKILQVITGFSFGASSVALFARVGGGIYTKGADVGADLVGKVEAGIPEDHPVNPAVIADNVGDNVGDVAGMGADLFESYVGSIISGLVLGAALLVANPENQVGIVLLPLVLCALGIITSFLGTFAVSVREGGNPQAGLNKGMIASSVLFLIGSYLVINWLAPEKINVKGVFGYAQDIITSTGLWLAVVTGLVVGILIGFFTELFTGAGKPPVRKIVIHSLTGVATNIIAGISVGMLSTVLPIILIAAGILISYHFAGLYGIALAAIGMLANTGIQLAVDAYGPVADNAGGIAEMSYLPPEVRKRTDKLDAVGNTTAAIGKGFAIGSAALTALAFFSAYMSTARLEVIDLGSPKVIAGLFIGAMMAFFFSALAIDAVGKAAHAMVREVRRQFNEIPALKRVVELMQRNADKPIDEWSEEDKKILAEAEGKPEYDRCVEIATRSGLKQMIVPGLTAVLLPVIIGLLGGKEMLAGLLAGVLISGVLLALFQANAGAAWDNAKKMVEEGFEWEGKLYKKGSDVHKATVVGDTVGDPLKDTSGPSLNILIKLMSIISLIIASVLV